MTSFIQSGLLDASEIKKLIAYEIQKTKTRIVIISPFVSNSIDWLESLCPSDINRILISRGYIYDFQSGASNIEDIKKAFVAGWRIGFIEHLHAKIYLFDESTAIIGSSNLTTRGLALNGIGNIEVSIRMTPTIGDIEKIDNLIDSSMNLTAENLDLMADILSEKKPNNSWPIRNRPLIQPLGVDDMLWVSPYARMMSHDNLIHDLTVLGISTLDNENLSDALMNTKVVNWLIGTVIFSESKICSFGYLAEKLHSQLGKEEKFYRKDVKEYLSILIDYIQYTKLSFIHITKANRSLTIQVDEIELNKYRTIVV